MIEEVTRHTFEYNKQHKVLKIVADLTEVGVPQASPGEQQQQQRQMHLMVEQQQEQLLHHVLLHVHLHAVTTLLLPFASSSAPYLKCVGTVRSDSRRRGRLGGRTHEHSSRFLKDLSLTLLGLQFQMRSLMT